MTSQHNDLTLGVRHGVPNWAVADEAARLALVVSDDDLYKFCMQLDTATPTMWILYSVDPDLWSLIGGSGGLTYNTETVVAGNITAIEGQLDDCLISGMTADRDWNLPTPSEAGVLCSVRIKDDAPASPNYEFIVKADGVELTSLFISGESIIYRSTGTGASDWEFAEGGDGRIASKALLTKEGATSIPHATLTQVIYDSVDINVGNLADIGNNKITTRRGGDYNLAYLGRVDIGDQKRHIGKVYNDTDAIILVDQTIYVSTSSGDRTAIANPTMTIPINADIDIIGQIYQDRGSSANMTGAKLLVKEDL